MIGRSLRTPALRSLAVGGWWLDGSIGPGTHLSQIATAEAAVGAPATPVSYAGVARRTTARAVTPGVGAPGVGAGGVGGPASGVGVLPGAGAGKAGVGGNLGGPVNRVGVR
jgi:hypothetical protein